MKKKLSILSLLFGLFVCVTVFCSCSKDDDNGSSASNPLVGTWCTVDGDGDYTELIYKADMTCIRFEHQRESNKIKETNYGRYQINGNLLSIWWDGNTKAWTCMFSINGNEMTTDEGGGTTWTRK